MSRSVVWIAEDEALEEDGWYLLGTFSGHVDAGGPPTDHIAGLSAEAAIAWGRTHAAEVRIRLGRGGYFSVGSEASPDLPPWPPADLPPLSRRRPPEDAWRDATDADPPITWDVAVWLTPEDVLVNGPLRIGREQWNTTIAAVAQELGAVSWDSEELEARIADLDNARGASDVGEGVAWISRHRPSYRIRITEHAPSSTLLGSWQGFS
jgi:hypothetical protein